jgi:hypothetical protein
MRRIFWGFCRNWFLMDPLHYLSSRSDFGFEFAEIFVIEKRLPDSANSKPKSEWLKMECEGPMPNRFMQKTPKIRLVAMSL